MNVITGSLSCRPVKALLAALLLMLVTMLCGCGGGGAPVNIHGDGTSGVRGTVVLATIGQQQTTPVPNAIVLVRRAYSSKPGVGASSGYGEVLAQTQADAQGNYSIALAPDYYGIQGKTPDANGYENTPFGTRVNGSQYTQLAVVITKPTSQ